MPNPLLDLLSILIFGPFYLAAIAIDRFWFKKPGGNPFLNSTCPRTVAECTPARIFAALKAHSIKQGSGSSILATAIPNTRAEDIELLSCETAVGAVDEPDKSVVRASIAVRNKTNTARADFELFFKMPTARPWPLSFKMIMAVFQPDHKEVCFYNQVVPVVEEVINRRGLQAARSENLSSLAGTTGVLPRGTTNAPGFLVPKKVFAHWYRTFDRAFLAFETVCPQYKCTPDWKGVGPGAVSMMLDHVAVMHAATWNLKDEAVAKLTNGWFRDRVGAAWMDSLIKLFEASVPPTKAQAAVWGGIVAALAKEPVCISHGDLRPGNVLFKSASTSDIRTAVERPLSLVVTDFESNAVTSWMWDASYCLVIGLTPAVRKQYERQIIEGYVKRLRELLQKTGLCSGEQLPTVDDALRQYRMLRVVVRYYSWAISQFGAVGDAQGNTKSDVGVWRDRVGEASHEVLRDEAAELAQSLPGVSEAVIKEFYDELKAEKVLKC